MPKDKKTPIFLYERRKKMLNQSHKLENQSIDLFLGKLEEEDLSTLGESFRKTIFGSEILRLQELQNEIIGLHSENESAGTSLFRKKDDLIFNICFGDMSLMEAEAMLSILHPLEGNLKKFCRVLKMSLFYVKENNESEEKNRNGFINEISMTPPKTLVTDENDRRLFQIKIEKDRTVYAFKSATEGMASFTDCIALLQSERISSEEIFMPSLNQWMG
ncbi:MAG: hypothetical protein ACOC5T_09705, partial [Elusimicrobiota bacterium]